MTALGFCHTKPHLLAAGGGDGVVAVFDLSKKEDASQLLVESTTATGKHSDPVYQVHWVNPTLGGVGGSVNGAGSFVSISTDGRYVDDNTSTPSPLHYIHSTRLF